MITRNKRLEQIKYVVDNSDNVKINENKISDYANMLKVNENNHYWLNKYKVSNVMKKAMLLIVFFVY